MSDDLAVYYDTIIPPGETGHLHLAVGLNGYFTAAGKYSFEKDKAHPDALWKPRRFRYPDERGDAFDWILDTAQIGDVYGCPNLLTGRHRNARTATSCQLVHGDFDTGKLDRYEVEEELGGIVVASGSIGHAQALIPMSEAVTEEQRMALCVALRGRYDGDDKIADNDVLRLPGTKNWKSRARDPKAKPTDVYLMTDRPPARRIKPYDLGRKLNIELSNIVTVNGSAQNAKTCDPDTGEPVCEPIDLGAYPSVRDELAKNSGDRSKDTYRIICGCVDVDLTLPQTRWVINSRADLKERIDDKFAHGRDDVAISWDKAKQEWQRSQTPGPPTGGAATQTAATAGSTAGAGGQKRWKATDLKSVAQQRFLAKNRIPRGAVTILCGDEGIGKSLLWVQIVVNVTTGKAFDGFGMPARAPEPVVLVITEDDWQTAVLPRLKVAGADLDMIEVICADDDGSGSPIFPDDMDLITSADPKPAFVVVDAWLDTVPSDLKVRDTQQSREALHPWKDAATKTDAAIMLLTHANRLATSNMRDKYGATAALRQKARMTLYALADPGNGNLIVGPDKANSTAGGTKASRFRICGVQYFEPTPDSDGTVPALQYDGDTDKTIKEHLAEIVEAEKRSQSKPTAAEVWLVEFLKDGPRKTVDVLAEGAKGDGIGYSPNQLKYAKEKVCGPAFKGGGDDTSWYWELLPGQMPQQRFWRS